MKPDLYTKAVLTVIAFMLVMIGCHQYTSPATTVKAEGPFAGVQFAKTVGTVSFFDPGTGTIWVYDEETKKVERHHKVVALGQPLQ